MQKLEFEDTYFRNNTSIRIQENLFNLTRPKVMGILNVTPDSFYEKSRVMQSDEILKRAEKMILDGADILDIGGYSSRPGAVDISIEEELHRVIEPIESLRREFPDSIISIDTFRSKVADEALAVGANIINDISGFNVDPRIIKVAKKHNAPYVLMHMRGNPQTMQDNLKYDNLVNDIIFYMSKKISILKKAGLHDIIIDPGFGFSKDIDQNHMLLAALNNLKIFDLPIMAGLSRKSMIYKKLGVSPEESLSGTIELNKIALEKGAKILRVHDVKEAKEIIESAP